MKSLEHQLSQYAAYHQDGRNVATHFIGIPLIVLAVVVLLSGPSFDWMGIPVSLAVIAALATAGYYLLLDRPFGVLMTVLVGLCVWFGAWAASMSTATWLSIGIGGFVVGWIFQFIGHAWEGRKPAFVDDLTGLVIGPLFIAAEAAFFLGMRPALRRAVEGKSSALRRASDGRKHEAMR